MVEQVSVVIPVLDGEVTIGRQLASLIQQSADIDEILVVDNGSSDRTVEVARSFDSPQLPVRVLHEPVRGANRARNTGIAAARNERILLCDADDETRPGWAAALSSLLEGNDLGGGTVLVVGTDPGIPSVILDPSAFPADLGLHSPIGCSAALRRSIWRQVGGFDPRIRRGCDEVDFFLRAQLHGASIAWSHEVLLTYHCTFDEQRLHQNYRDTRVNLGRVRMLGWLHGHPRRASVLPSLPKALASLPAALVRPTQRNRARFRHYWESYSDRARSLLLHGLPELIRWIRTDRSRHRRRT